MSLHQFPVMLEDGPLGGEMAYFDAAKRPAIGGDVNVWSFRGLRGKDLSKPWRHVYRVTAFVNDDVLRAAFQFSDRGGASPERAE